MVRLNHPLLVKKRQRPTLTPGMALPSALVSLTSLFGMGRGGSSLLLPPQYSY